MSTSDGSGELDCPVIIGGAHRSGTSLVRRIFNGHTTFYCPPEIKLHKDLLGQHLTDPLAHARLGSSIKALGIPDAYWLDEFTRAYCRCMTHAARLAGKARWADKNPENALNAEHWFRALDSRMAFIMVVRDPRDIFASMIEVGMPMTFPAAAMGKVAHLSHYIEAGLLFAEQHPDISRIIRYEDVVLSPHQTLEGLFGWLGCRFEPETLSMLKAPIHGSGLEDPKIALEDSPHARSIGRWRSDASSKPSEWEGSLASLSMLIERLGYA